MKKKTKLIIFLGMICMGLMAASSWYAVSFNDARFVKQMGVSEYDFRIQDLPMIISLIAVMLYVLYLFVLLIRTIIENRKRESSAQVTRRINPKRGFLGFLGFMGFGGFWTYHNDKVISPFIYFIFFGFFGFFFEGKMSDTFMDERYKENKMKARSKANSLAMDIIFIALLVLGSGRLLMSLEYTLIAFVIVVAFSIALALFLGEYLLYRYDHDEQITESEE